LSTVRRVKGAGDTLPGCGGVATVTVTEAFALPFTPLQTKVKVDVVAKEPVDSDPDRALAPDQLPDAVQASTFEELQLSVALEFSDTDPGLADRFTEGGGGLFTITVTDLLIEPPAPMQLKL
jgi:hypothetical protein